jgi:hypothetical protein
MSINAFEELEKEMKGIMMSLPDITACWFGWDGEDFHSMKESLKIEAFNEKSAEVIKKILDKDYDNGFGVQKLFGVVWFLDGTWLEREVYDGNEWWRHLKTPEFPDWDLEETLGLLDNPFLKEKGSEK